MPTHCISLHRFSEVVQISSNALHLLPYFQDFPRSLNKPGASKIAQPWSMSKQLAQYGSVRLPSEIYATQAAGLPESVGGPTVRICSAKQMQQPHEIVDAEDQHEHPKRECFKYLKTNSKADTDMSSFFETCTADTQELFRLPSAPGQALPNSNVLPKSMPKGPKPPTGPPLSKPRPPVPPQAASSKASSSNTCVQPSEDAEEPPIKVQKLGNEALAAEEVRRSPSRCSACSAPVTPEVVTIPVPVSSIGLSSLSGGAPSSAEMTCPTMVANVAAEAHAKVANLYSPENWRDRINFRRSITTQYYTYEYLFFCACVSSCIHIVECSNCMWIRSTATTKTL